jgi:hypothetical protein
LHDYVFGGVSYWTNGLNDAVSLNIEKLMMKKLLVHFLVKHQVIIKNLMINKQLMVGDKGCFTIVEHQD